uniref:Protein kinase domain-containing protein n=1 Tax=Parascaris univalens TaxID=6257 RepID=A0A914ZT02_PARUN
MSVLISDAAFCPNDLSRLLLSPAAEWSFQARIVNIAQSGSLIAQHTQYQLIIAALPKNSIDLDERYFSIWTRFKDLNRLWSQLSKVHQQLYLHGTFPPFAPPKLFGNAEAAVIAERIDATRRFLNFVLANEVLRKTRILHQFLEKVKEVPSQVDPTQPLTSTAATAQSASGTLGVVSSEQQEVGSEMERQYPTEGNTPSASNDPLTEGTSVTSSVLTMAEASAIRTLSASQSTSSSTPSCIFDFPDVPIESATISSVEAVHLEETSPILAERGSASRETNSFRADNTNGASNAQHWSIIERIVPRIFSSGGTTTQQRHTDRSQRHRESNFYSQLGASPLSGNVSRSSSSPRLVATSNSTTSSPIRHGMTNDNQQNDYLVQASQLISMAHKAESERTFELAFHCYKIAVNALLQGVQYERDSSRRDAVRKKTAKYLLRAEKLYRSYLSFDGSTVDLDSWLSNTLHDPNLIAFQSSNAALKSYRILGILPSASANRRVLLVEERNAAESGTKYVMKLLEKSTNACRQHTSTSACTTVPMHISNMVQLHKFFDTDNFIILLLEYVKHGTLWHFLEEYFEEYGQRIQSFMGAEPYESDIHCEEDHRKKTFPTVPVNTDKCEEVTAGPSTANDQPETRAKSNVYEGKHVRFSVGSEDDEPMDLADEPAFDQLLRKSSGKMSLDSFDSGTSCYDVSVVAGSNIACEENPSSSPFQSVLHDTVNVTAVDCFTLDEEAPALVNLSYRSATSSSNASRSYANAEEKNTQDAVRRAQNRLRKDKRWPRNEHLPESLIVHWTAQLVSAVCLLHSQGVIIRDLRPDNLLIDEEANLKLTYCSRWNDVDVRVDEDAINNCYAAPELLSVTQVVDEAADRWSIGAIMFELLCGQKLSGLCLHGLATAVTIPIPEYVDISFAARDLLSRLLLTNPLERLSDEDLRAHPFFNECDWRVYDGMMSGEDGVVELDNREIAEVRFKVQTTEAPSCEYRAPKSLAEPLSPHQLMAIAGEEGGVHAT